MKALQHSHVTKWTKVLGSICALCFMINMIGKSYPDLGTGMSRRLNIPQPEEICIDDMLHIHRSLETVDLQSVELECTLDNEGTDNENCKYTNYDEYTNRCKEAKRGDSNLIGTMLEVDFVLKCELSNVKYINYPFCSAKSCENNDLHYRVDATLEEL